MRQIVIIAHNLRSLHNVGSILRTAEGLGVEQVYLTGYSPYPRQKIDTRLPHQAEKADKHIAKTALGAQKALGHYIENIDELISGLKHSGFEIAAIEQGKNSIALNEFVPTNKLALIVGREVEGIESEIIKLCDYIVEIPMFGDKESFNVAQAMAMATYHCRFFK